MKWECSSGRVSRWRRWFAWYPIKIDCTVYWLVYVYRKGRIVYASRDGRVGSYVAYTYSLNAPKEVY